MHTHHILSIANKTALLGALLLMSACADIGDAYRGVVGGEPDSSRKTEIKSPGAAPYQEVKTVDNSHKAAVELGAVRDDSLDAASAQLDQAPTIALLTVRFNQPHVYYDDALTQAVSAAENAKTDVVYEVLSTVPDLTSLPPEQQQKLSARAKDNLRNVVTKMQQLGVPADRIRIADQTLKIRSQEIQLFVK